MSLQKLEKHLPDGAFPFLGKWFGEFYIHINISRERTSKLGDYQKQKDGSHKISVNHNLAPELFFFVLTHELAHLIAFEKFGRKILPHGTEWKKVYREMLLESIGVYSGELQPIILKFAKNPAANFSVNRDLVKFFGHGGGVGSPQKFIEELSAGDSFLYKNTAYLLETKLKKNYLCTNLATQKKYIFKPAAVVTLL